jgi:hypothetical protein
LGELETGRAEAKHCGFCDGISRRRRGQPQCRAGHGSASISGLTLETLKTLILGPSEFGTKLTRCGNARPFKGVITLSLLNDLIKRSPRARPGLGA